jgi:uncharacterized cupredoxin-like copper-binding protein
MSMTRRTRVLWSSTVGFLLAGSVLLAACGGSDDPKPTSTPHPPIATATQQATAPAKIQVDMADYSFTAPDSVDAGWVEVHAKNTGKEMHHAQFVRLNEGVTVEQLNTAFAENPESALGMVTLAGGIGAINPGEEQTVYVELDGGQYVLVCLIAGEDGVPHLAKGMEKALTVTGTGGSTAQAPQADIMLGMNDFSFDMPDTLDAGEINIMVMNHGKQPHEWVLLKLDEDKSIDDVKAYFAAGDETAPPPGTEAGGVQAMSSGASSVVTMNFKAGNYVAVCFIPDADSGKAHAELGMLKAFTVS